MSYLRAARNRLLTGLAVVIPLIVSGWVLVTLAQALANFLGPLSAVFGALGFTSTGIVLTLQTASVLTILAVLFIVGTVAQRQLGRRVVDIVDTTVQRIPGIGTIYQTVRQMSDLLLAADETVEDQFREVKLVEFPGQQTYTLGFVTAPTPPAGVVDSARAIQTQPDMEYRTLFLPMAPNPVMGGHLTHVPAHQVYDVDITVEEAIQYILTTGLVNTGK